MVNIALCDDDRAFADTLAGLVKTFFENRDIPARIDAFPDGRRLAERYTDEEKPYDIVFLDIDMPGLNGKDTARTLRGLDSSFRLIFISSYQNEVFNCFEYGLSDFIPKQMLGERLDKSLERAVEAICKQPARLFFNVRDKNNEPAAVRVLPEDILYFECIQKRVYLNLKKGLETESLCLAKCRWKDIEARFGGGEFIQPHRGYLVRIKAIAAVRDDRILLDNGAYLPLGRRNKKAVEGMLLNMLD